MRHGRRLSAASGRWGEGRLTDVLIVDMSHRIIVARVDLQTRAREREREREGERGSVSNSQIWRADAMLFIAFAFCV